MKAISELKSLEEINYTVPKKILSLFLIPPFFFMFSFFLNFPFSQKLESFLKKSVTQPNCHLKLKNLQLGLLLPSISAEELKIPKGCFNSINSDIDLSNVSLQWRVVSFFPFGIPFKVETKLNGENLEFFFIQGISTSTLRMIDQKISSSLLENLLGPVKIKGDLISDATIELEKFLLHRLDVRITSKNIALPSQNIEGFNTPELKLNDFFLEAKSESDSKINIEKLIFGTPESPIRGNFKGKIDLKSVNIKFSPLSMNGEVSFSQELKEKIPLIDMIFQTFPQKDGFYQIKLGGTLGAPKTLGP